MVLAFRVDLSGVAGEHGWTKEHTKTMRLVLAGISNFCDATGRAWPAVSTIAASIDCTKALVLRAVTRLEKAKLLTVVRRPTRRESNTYRVDVAALDRLPKLTMRTLVDGDVAAAEVVSPQNEVVSPRNEVVSPRNEVVSPRGPKGVLGVMNGAGREGPPPISMRRPGSRASGVAAFATRSRA
jgi:hypothetical protein